MLFAVERARRRFNRISLPSPLKQVYGAIAFYLGHQIEVDANIREGEKELRRLVPPFSPRRPEAFYQAPARSRTDQSFVSILFQADNDLTQLIVAATYRGEPSIDFQTAHRDRL